MFKFKNIIFYLKEVNYSLLYVLNDKLDEIIG